MSENPSTSLRTSSETRIGVFICECGEESQWMTSAKMGAAFHEEKLCKGIPEVA